MTTRTVVACDRCGSEVPPAESWRFTLVRDLTPVVDVTATRDLCDDCERAFARFMENRDATPKVVK